ncbi:MAG TPA: APC family permease, partial [Streptosporangiaceae bacterium]|nr:APC family permease [Streptosporangiaceae bacterium]
MASESVAEEIVPTDVGLKRELGLVGATWTSETSIIGSGWLFGALFAAQAVGGAAVFAWAIAGVVVILLALCHAELGAMYPVSGGTARFPHFAFGSVAGIGFGFFSYLQAVTIAPVECFAFMQYASYYWPSLFNTDTGNVTGPGFVLTIVLMAIFTAVNFLAMRIFARVNNVITWWKVAIPVLAIIVLLFKFHPGNFTAGGAGFMPGGVHGLFAALPGAGIIFAYSGFEQADQLAGEIKNPGRNLPRAIILAVLIGTAIYCLLQVAFIGAMPASLLGHGWTGLACPETGPCQTDVAHVVAGPFAAVAALGGLAWLGHILRIDAFVSPSGTGLIYVTGTSRVSYGLARNRYFPQIFDRVNNNGVPWVGLIFAFIIGLFFLLPFPSWHSLVNLITAASLLMYAGAPLALGAFRGQVPDANRPYRLPAEKVLAPLAFIIANLILYWSDFETLWKLSIVLVIGYVLIGIMMAFDKQRPPLDWKSAVWLPFWLIGMLIISWQGQYGPGNTGNIPFWWDMVVVAAFSLVIWYWAMATKLPREEMLNLVERQGAHGD